MLLLGVYIGGAIATFSALSTELRPEVSLWHALRWPLWLLFR